MDAAAAPFGLALNPGFVSLAALSPGTSGRVIGVGSGSPSSPLSALERRLLEFGFVNGEQVEILAEARPGRDPFVVRIGHTTLALRRREAQSIWVEVQHPESATAPPEAVSGVSERVEVQRSESGASTREALGSGLPA
jgi:ferrous iron transport protein A